MTRPFHPALLLLLLTLLLSAGCAQPAPPAAPATELQLPTGYAVEVAAEGLRGPTQMILGPDGRLWLAQLNGRENAGDGQVIALDLDSAEMEVLLDGLQKPTGIAVLDGALWIATERDILRAPLDANGRPTAPEAVLSDLPYNGRSNGTLTPTPQGGLLYETSGRRSGSATAPGSGVLWQLDPTDPTNPTPLATGLKGAYAHVFDESDRLWITEIGDGQVNGEQPPEEINLVVPGADFGWPQCFGFQEAARNNGGTPERCANTRAPVALFEPQTTPTSIAISPWEPDVLLVALWTSGSIMRLPVTVSGNNAAGSAEAFITGLQNPQHLLPLPDGSLLISDHSAGTLYRVTRR